MLFSKICLRETVKSLHKFRKICIKTKETQLNVDLEKRG